MIENRFTHLLSMSIVLAIAPLAAAQTQSNPKLEEVFSSIQENVGGSSIDFTRWFALLAAMGALGLVVWTIRKWSQERATPKAVRNPRKLLKEVMRSVPIPARSLKNLEEAASAEGLSSPMVAMICPSVLKKLASRAKTNSERQAILDLAQTIERSK